MRGQRNKGYVPPRQHFLVQRLKEEYDRLMALAVQNGSAIPLKKRPNSFLFRSTPSDVARVEDRTYICTRSKSRPVPPTTGSSDELKTLMTDLYKGCMQGRPCMSFLFPWAPIGSTHCKIGVEITDSPYVVCNMHIMTVSAPSSGPFGKRR
jgi:phosphoenolpyruvate carboxykinase (GTP)